MDAYGSEDELGEVVVAVNVHVVVVANVSVEVTCEAMSCRSLIMMRSCTASSSWVPLRCFMIVRSILESVCTGALPG